MSPRKLTATLAIAIASSLTLISAALADPASTYPQSSCTGTTVDGVYIGEGNTVFKDGDLALTSCHANGSSPQEKMNFKSGNCHLVVTPSGRYNLTCN